MEYYKIVNLEKYQKLSKTSRYAIIDFKILNDDKIYYLTDAQRWLFIGLIILACQTNNCIPADSSLIYSRVCHRSQCGGGGGIRAVRVGIQRLLENGIIDRKIDRKIENNSNLNKISLSDKLGNYNKVIKGNEKVDTTS